MVLVGLGWGTVWALAIGTDWARGRRSESDGQRLEGSEQTSGERPDLGRGALPYTRAGSPASRIGQAAARLAEWWRLKVWPEFRPEVLGLLPALALIGVLALILPTQFLAADAALAGLVGLGLVWRRRQRDPLACAALAAVGLPWLAGHLAIEPLSSPSVALAMCFSLAAWGLLRLRAGGVTGRGGVWLLNGGQVLGLALLAAGKQALVAGALGLLLFGQVALQPSLSWGAAGSLIARRTWPWLMAAMLLAGVAVR